MHVKILDPNWHLLKYKNTRLSCHMDLVRDLVGKAKKTTTISSTLKSSTF